MEKQTGSKQMRFTDEELDLIKKTFHKNEKLLKIMRKVFLPEYDVDAPLGQNIDLWMTINLSNMSQMDKEVRLQARNEVITHIETQLVQLDILSNMKEETDGEKEARKKADSTR